MAEKKTTKKTTKKKTTTKKEKEVKEVVDNEVKTEDIKVEEEPKVEEKVKKPVRRPKKKVRIDRDELFNVISNVTGELVFKAKDNSFEQTWSDSDDYAALTYEELQKIRREGLRFFKDNWLVIEEQEDGYSAEDVYAALNVDKYYRNECNTIEDLEYLFLNGDTEEIKEEVDLMGTALKQKSIDVVYGLVANGDIDSRSRINLLSSLLGYDFEEDA